MSVDLNVYKWFVIGWFVFGALISVASVGQTRKPTTPGLAVSSVVVSAALIALVVIS
jgi:hypothetical protein